MAKQNRLIWSTKAVGLAGKNSTDFTEVHGLQTATATTNFNLEQVFEIGQIELYENIEEIADMEFTVEKVIDGYPLIYHLATQDATKGTLSGRGSVEATLAISVFDDENDSASGTPLTELNASGLFVNSLNYTIPVDGNATENVGLVGNNLIFKPANFTFSGQIFDNTDEPLALTSGTGGVQRRENLVFDIATAQPTDTNGMVDGEVTVLPRQIAGISSSGTNDKDADGDFKAHVQNITLSTDLGRDNLFELGRKVPYFRPITFPVEVTTDIEIISLSGNMIAATEEGVSSTAGDNLQNESIRIKLEESTFIDVGTKNKLQSVSTDGGGTDGGNTTETYSYSSFNTLKITHDQDPSALS